MKILIYDCEIIRVPMPKGISIVSLDGPPKIDDIEYCHGWRDFDNMGVSVVGFYYDGDYCCHSNPDNAIPYNFPQFRDLLEGSPYVVGFNTKHFDDKLLRANRIKIKTDYDLLDEIRRAAYGSTKWDKQPKGHSYGLDAIAKANGMAKTGSGSLAPKLWQEGKRDEVISYCTNDVRITYEMLKLGIEGNLKDPNTGKLLKLRSFRGR